MDWKKIIADEDRIIRNADRRFRRHSYSLESMSDEFVYMNCHMAEHSDPLEEVLITDFVDTVRNEQLAVALRQLTDRQRRMIELAYWEGYPFKDIAVIMGCKPNTVSQLISRAKKHFYIALTQKVP